VGIKVNLRARCGEAGSEMVEVEEVCYGNEIVRVDICEVRTPCPYFGDDKSGCCCIVLVYLVERLDMDKYSPPASIA